VVSLRAVDESAFAEEVRRQVGTLVPDGPVTTHVVSVPDEPAAARRAIRDVMAERGDGLLILDAPPDRGAVPPLADDWTRALVAELDAPLFVANEAARPDAVETILVPTDLSDESMHTLRHATELADGYDASVVLLHVIDTSPYVALTPVDRLSLGSTTLTEHRAHRRLQQFLRVAQPPDVPIQTRIAFGEPADCIAHAVTEQAVDLLVLASHGAGDGPEPSLGPVADRVLRRVACPTILVRAGDRSLLPGPRNANSTAEPDG
jgi:nucleotide-binding universal stress UspA family protein